jgi:predicted aconitase
MESAKPTFTLFTKATPRAERIEAAGGTVLSGMCFYQSYAREMAEANGWQRLATNSAKLVNIIGGYGYRPALLSMEACIEAACRDGRIAR